MVKPEPPRLAIVGGGPVGVEAALYAARCMLPFALYERGRVAEHVRRSGHVKLFTPFAAHASALGKAALRAEHPRTPLPADADALTGGELLERYYLPLTALPEVAPNLRLGEAVVAIGRRPGAKRPGPFRLLVRDGRGEERIEEADAVLDCTGARGRPRRLGEYGLPAIGETAARPHIEDGVPDVLGAERDKYAEKSVLVVGAGHAAATAICLLSRLAEEAPGTWVTWLARGAGTQPIRRVVGDPLKERDRVAGLANRLATRGEGHIEFHARAAIVSIRHKDGFTVAARVGDAERAFTADRLVAAVGHEPGERLYQGADPSNYFPLAGGRADLRAAFAALTGKPGLDLDRAAA